MPLIQCCTAPRSQCIALEARTQPLVPAVTQRGGLFRQDTWEWAPVELQQNAVRPSPRDFAAMVDLPSGKLLLFGGLDASEKRLDDTWIFDTITWVSTYILAEN